MLRRRIFSGAMASVMALSSVAVVASAEETTKQYKTEEDLKNYVASFDDFRANELYEYGSISGENFLNALEYADTVLNDTDSDADDYTVAYAMIEAVYKSLTIYSADELQTLIETCTGIYETNNIYNEELGDAIYDADTFSNFEDAYGEAESVLDSNDSRLITDAYEQLTAAKNGLSKLATVTKSQFRSALKSYEQALQNEFDYETWRIGKVDVSVPSAGWAAYSQSMAYGTLYEHIESINGIVNEAYEELDEIEGLSKTSNPDIVDAYKACVDAATVLKGFTADDTARATKANVKSLLNTYHGRLVYDYCTTSAEALYAKVVEVLGNDKVSVLNRTNKYSTDYVVAKNATTPWCIDEGTYKIEPNGNRTPADEVTKLISAEITVKSTETSFYIGLDEDGYWNGVVSKEKPSGDYKLVSKKAAVDLTDFIAVTSADVDEWSAKSATDNHYYNNVVDGDWRLVDVDLSTESVADFKTWADVEFGTWAYDQVVAGLEAKDFYDAENDALNEAGIAYFDAAVAQGYQGEEFFAANNWANWALDFMFYSFYNLPESELVTQMPKFSNQIGQWGEVKFADQKMDGTYSGYKTYTDLLQALEMAEVYLAGDKDAIAAMDMKDIDTTDSIAAGSAKGSSAEWTMIYRYLKYALSDKYDASYGTHTKAEVLSLIDDCYELAELTGDAALFSVNHNALVDARQDALDWVKAANKIKTYKDNVTAANGQVATQVYDALWGEYEQLKKDYEAFKYSFEEVYEAIAEVSNKIDDGDLEATTALMAALNDAAYYLSVVAPLADGDGNEIADNAAFTSDREFQGFNRIQTIDDGYDLETLDGKVSVGKARDNGNPSVNYSHYQLKTAYEALLAAVEAQAAPQVLLGDVDGNGTVNALDAAALLTAIVDGKALDAAVADYDKSGAVNALDASAILTAIVNG